MLEETKTVVADDREQPRRDGSRAPEGPDRARRRPERLLYGVLRILRRLADPEAVRVQAAPVPEQELLEGRPIAALGGGQDLLGVTIAHARCPPVTRESRAGRMDAQEAASVP